MNSPIDLPTIALKLTTDNEAIREKAKSNSLIITAKKLATKLPELTKLGNLPLILISHRKKVYQTLLPAIYRLNDEIVITLPDLNCSVTKEFEIESFKIEQYSTAIIKHKKSEVLLKINLGVNIDFKFKMLDDFLDTLEGKGEELTTDMLLKKPFPEKPLKVLKKGETYTIISHHKKSKEFKTTMIDVKDSLGNVIENVICNSDLARYAINNGEKFKIRDIKEVKQKILTGKDKGKTKAIIKIEIIPLDGDNFSDLNF